MIILLYSTDEVKTWKICLFGALMLIQGQFWTKVMIIDHSDHLHWILQLHISQILCKYNENTPWISWKCKNKAKMLIPGPICSIRAECGTGSCQISPFLTSEIDSTGWKPNNINPQIHWLINLGFCHFFEPRPECTFTSLLLKSAVSSI